ncbi:DoxX family membrane protein [Tenacibaculum sp.]|nr:DoxX family membrane protein [Tenacibaculum sp.]
MKMFNSTFFLRFAVAIILLAHGVPEVLSNGANDFGNFFLNKIGFDPLGVPIAWSIKISHIVAAFCLLFEKYVKWASIITIFVLFVGIILVHFKEGWFVVGRGGNGVEFSFLLIFALLTIIFPNGLKVSKKA